MEERREAEGELARKMNELPRHPPSPPTTFYSLDDIPKSIEISPSDSPLSPPLTPMSTPSSQIQEKLPQASSTSTMDLSSLASSLPPLDSPSSPGTERGLDQPQDGVLTGENTPSLRASPE